MEGWRSTAELFPQLFLLVAGALRGPSPAKHSAPEAAAVEMVGRGGFEPPKACASRFTVCPLWPLGYLPEPNRMIPKRPKRLELARGFEPPTRCLQGSRSTSELRQHRQTFMLLSDLFEVNGFFLKSRPLAHDLVADDRTRRRDVEGADPPTHGKGYQKVTGPGNEWSKAGALPP